MIATAERPKTLHRPAPARPQRVAVSRPMIGAAPRREEISYSAVATLVVWLACAAVSIVGVLIPYARPQAPRKEPPVIRAEPLVVKLDSTPETATASTDASLPSAPPPPAAIAAATPPPSLVAVAEASPAIAFAVPVEGPVRVVEANQAAHGGRVSSNAATSNVAAGAPQTLIFGQGEGRQPAPTYPARAVRDTQQGTVGVRLTVDQQGHVIAAEAIQPCVWPLLNEAALKVVRERWQFSPGATRVYDVAIHFRLKK